MRMEKEKKKKKIWIKVIIIFLSVIILTPLAVRLFFILTTRGRFVSTETLSAVKSSGEEPYDAVVVLGCGVYSDSSLSPLLTYRMEKTLEVYRTGAAKKIYITGDHREGEYDEVDHMAEWLYAQGVSDEDLILDYRGYSTWESMEHAGSELKRVIIVTQPYHLYRALYLARHFGLEAVGAPSRDWQFSAGTVSRHLREIPACVKDLLQCIGISINI